MHRAAALTVGALLAVLLLALVFTLGFVSNDGDGGTAQFQGQTSEPIDITIDGAADFDTLQEIVDILASEYIGRENLDIQLLYEAAISGLIESLADTGTFYIDPNSFQLSIGPSGSFEGIGATVQQQDNEVIIVRPFEGSPAEAAGILPGDVILAVDGESAQGWSVNKTVLRIRGPEGTDVTITIRHLDGVEAELTITRAEIQVDSVTTAPPGGVLRDDQGDEATDLGYIRISEFTERTPQEVRDAVNEYLAAGVSGLIIDVRSNPGGLLDETVETADIFLDKGVILIEVDRNGQERFHRASEGGAALDIPIVLLQDEFSASGSEVLAAALRDNGRATVIGTTSFGKGTVNQSQPLSDGGALFVTIRTWLTPNGIQIDGVGIRPDVEAGPGPLDPQYDPQNDAQIIRAIEHLRSIAVSEAPVPSSAAP